MDDKVKASEVWKKLAFCNVPRLITFRGVKELEELYSSRVQSEGAR
jgi:hypothetical protein